MVEIAVVLDAAGCLSRMSLNGHADYDPESDGRGKKPRTNERTLIDPACAAVTLMARSVARLTVSRTGWTVDGAAPVPGNLSLVIDRRPEDTDEWLRGVTDTLIQALADIDEEYPGTISVSLEEINNGS